ncbi:MAG TPA: Ig-like domain-containing protein [Anaerolineales bacterium]|nr:Ig-like domain-containing protein [Anaerolineales bacterium]HLO33729.1 Ig-like domain-containing protein [Anaerolineales bacterium]
MKISLQRLFVTFVVTVLGTFNFATPAHASESNFQVSVSAHQEFAGSGVSHHKPTDLLQGKPTNLTIEPLKPVALGDHPVLTVHLTAQFGQPIPNQPIIIMIDGKRKAAGKTDSRGVAVIELKYKFSAGTFHIEAIYPGISSIGLPRTTAKVDMTVQPAKVAIYTVPPMPGVSFKLNNKTYTTDKNGAADLQVNLSGIYTLEILPIDKANLPSNIRVEFSRWNDNVFTAKRQIYFPRTRRIEAGFIVDYQVNQVFYDSTHELVDPARVSSMVIKGVGTTYTFNGAGPIWLPSNRLTRRIGETLQSEEILYYFRNVTIDGADVINKGEQRFHIHPDDVWPIQVLLYSVRFSARDAMFHFPIGKGVQLTYPDGHKKEYYFSSSKADLTIPSLARGSYSARIIGAIGSAPPTPIHLSRDQDVELLMLSGLDIGLIVSVPLLIALAFFFFGRPHWLRVVRHPSKYKELVYQNAQRDISLKS